ncbi:AAA family ATPase [Siphonobacter sp. BAB-5385]|uniref:AAA family ATPase n=1 Tax=Siphonobacter sp. BAB-5385 TaxID=1864822 RepID=UPI0011405492|nr:AAA family ATPase [Siphonobacter sp. BAB-5385]
MQRIIISGGPGAGKSTLLEALQDRGYPTSVEVSRLLIQEQVQLGSKQVPWNDLSGFAGLALERMQRAYQQAQGPLTFFDRGIPDILAYLRVGNIPLEPEWMQVAHQYPYAPWVLMAPPWKEIYVNDAERWQTFAEATRLYETLSEVYQSLGYQLIVLPQVSVAERVAFVETILKKWFLEEPLSALTPEPSFCQSGKLRMSDPTISS